MSNYTKAWLRAACIRAVKTFAQTAAAIIGTSVFMNEVDWLSAASASFLAGMLSVITSIAGLPEVNKEYGNGDD